MPGGGGQINLELIIRSVSCPGVWLCPKGCVTLSVQLFGLKLRTKPAPAAFPVLFNTKFKFTKTLGNEEGSKGKGMFDEDQLHCKLLQWPKKPLQGKARILATYIGAVEDLIYSPEFYTNSKVDLLMKPAPIFPGIIAPKIEMDRNMTVSGLPEDKFVTRYDTVFMRNCYDRNLEDIDDSQCEQYCKIDAKRKENFWMMNLGHLPRQRTVCHHPKNVKCNGSPR